MNLKQIAKTRKSEIWKRDLSGFRSFELSRFVCCPKLRKTIRAAAPQAEECINNGIAAFRLNGKNLVGFGASAKHCSFYRMNGSTVAAFQDELKNYETSKGCIRFSAAKPLPSALVRKLVKARIAENGG